MNSVFRIAALVLLTAFIAGCRHKTNAAPPTAAQAPAAPISQSVKNTPPPDMPPPVLPNITPPGSDNTATAPMPKPHKTVHHKPKPSTETPTDQGPAKDQTPTEQASSGTASGISPIGQLSAEGESTNVPRQNQILDEINATEKGLNDIKRPLSKEEQTTAAEIKTFLTKAKDALNQQDLDAANSLVTRAKVLLEELTKP